MGETRHRSTGLIIDNVTGVNSVTLPSEDASDTYAKENGIRLKPGVDTKKRIELRTNDTWNPLFFYTLHRQLIAIEGGEIEPDAIEYQDNELIGRSVEVFISSCLIHPNLSDRFSYTRDLGAGKILFSDPIENFIPPIDADKPRILRIMKYPYVQEVIPPDVFSFLTEPADTAALPGATFELSYEVQNGTGPYMYIWTNLTNSDTVSGSTGSISNTLSRTALVTEQWQVEVTDANGNIITSDPATVIINEDALRQITTGWSNSSPWDDYDNPPGMFNTTDQGMQDPSGDITVTFPVEADYTYFVIKVEGTFTPLKGFWYMNSDNKGALTVPLWLNPYIAAGNTYYVSAEPLIIPLGTSLILKSSL